MFFLALFTKLGINLLSIFVILLNGQIIPRVAEGPWLLKNSIGTKPAILGRKIQLKYHRSHRSADSATGRLQGAGRYLEVDVDISSSGLAKTLSGMVMGAAQALTIDLAFLLEGQEKDELPERVIGSISLNEPNFNALIGLTQDGQEDYC